MMTKELTVRLTGFIASLLLTLCAYFIILNPASFGLHVNTALTTILILAFMQSIVQLICFIHVWDEEGGTFWNLGIFVSTASIIFIVIFFSIWIINTLNSRM